MLKLINRGYPIRNPQTNSMTHGVGIISHFLPFQPGDIQFERLADSNGGSLLPPGRQEKAAEPLPPP
jgi:hypothetical protein